LITASRRSCSRDDGAWETYRARFDHAFGIESQGFSASAFCPLASRS
jgi:hypothetical protein